MTSWELSGPWHSNSIPLKCPKSNLWRNSFLPPFWTGVCIYLIISLVDWPSLKEAPCHLPWTCSKPSLYKLGRLKTQLSRELNCIRIRLRLFDSQKQGQSEANQAKAIVQPTNPGMLFTKGLSQLVGKEKKYPERNAGLGWIELGESSFFKSETLSLCSKVQNMSFHSFVDWWPNTSQWPQWEPVMEKEDVHHLQCWVSGEPRWKTMSPRVRGWACVSLLDVFF